MASISFTAQELTQPWELSADGSQDLEAEARCKLPRLEHQTSHELAMEPSEDCSTTPLLRLPNEILLHILSYIPRHDLYATILVNRQFHLLSLASANQIASKQIQAFRRSLIEKLSQEAEQPQGLQAISDQVSEGTLMSWNHRLLRIEDEFANVLKTCAPLILSSLQTEILPPVSMKNIFTMAAIAREIDRADQHGFAEHALFNCVENLIKIRRIERACVVANLINPNNEYYSLAFQKISIKWLDMGNLQKARDTTAKILDNSYKASALKQIGKRYLQAGDISMAINIAEQIHPSESNQRGTLLLEIVKVLLRSPRKEDPLRIAQMIGNSFVRSDAFHLIIDGYLKLKDFKKAKELASPEKNDSLSYKIFKSILYVDVKEAENIANQIICGTTQDKTFQELSFAYMNGKNYSQARIIANKISNETLRSYTHQTLSLMQPNP